MTTLPGRPLCAYDAADHDKALTGLLESIGEPKFRKAQILQWIFVRHAASYDDMTNLPLRLRSAMEGHFPFSVAAVEADLVDSVGTRKLGLRLADGEIIEMALIPGGQGRDTACVSSQAGCPVGCAFCASGVGGLARNLAAGEIHAQFAAACRVLGGKPDNLVVMGVGEPLLNYDNLEEALARICSSDLSAFGARRVTISTSGVPSGILRLADSGFQWNLAVSLHAPDDDVRARIIPGKIRWPIREILDACRLYFRKTRRVVTLEYVLLAGVNDASGQARGLAAIARSLGAKINLIPYNKTPGFPFERPAPAVCASFESALRSAGANVTTRVEKGSGISAACGQLRHGKATLNRTDG